MRKHDSPDWGYFGAAWSVVAVGLGFLVMSSYQSFGMALVFLGLLLMLFSLRPTFRSLVQSRTLRRVERERATEQNRKAAEDAAKRERLIPELAAWDPFHLAASVMLGRFYEARDTKGPAEWNAFSDARDRAIALTPDLHEPARGMALKLLQPFIEVGQDDLDACSGPAAYLGEWLMDWHIRYYHARRAVGLPELPQAG